MANEQAERRKVERLGIPCCAADAWATQASCDAFGLSSNARRRPDPNATHVIWHSACGGLGHIDYEDSLRNYRLCPGEPSVGALASSAPTFYTDP